MANLGLIGTPTLRLDCACCPIAQTPSALRALVPRLHRELETPRGGEGAAEERLGTPHRAPPPWRWQRGGRRQLLSSR
jgi:hypothetical protein